MVKNEMEFLVHHYSISWRSMHMPALLFAYRVFNNEMATICNQKPKTENVLSLHST